METYMDIESVMEKILGSRNPKLNRLSNYISIVKRIAVDKNTELDLSEPDNYKRTLLYQFEDFHLSESITKILASFIKDVIDKNSMEIVVENNEQLTKEVNSYIKKLRLKDRLINDIFYIIYYGGISYVVENNELKPLKFQYETIRSDKYKYYIYNGNNYISINEKSIISIEANIRKIRDNFTEQLLLSSDDSLIKNDEYYIYLGLMEPYVDRLFLYYVLDFLVILLTFKNSLSFDVIKAVVSDMKIDESEIVQSINIIESFLNSFDLDIISYIHNGDILPIYNKLYEMVRNGTRVVPDLPHITSLDKLDILDLSPRIEELKNRRDELEDRIYLFVGIPKELYEGNATRWELIQRNSRILTIIENITKSITNSIINHIRIKYNIKEDVKVDMPIDQNNILSSIASINKIEISKQKIQAVSDLLSSISDILDRYESMIDMDKFVKYVRDQINSIDPKLSETLKDKIDKSREKLQDDGW